MVGSLDRSLRQALPLRESTGRELAEAIAHTSQRLQVEGARPQLADELEALCGRADWVLQHRQHLMDQLGSLCFELTARGVKSISELLRTTRERQAELRVTRDGARQALKSMIHDMLAELGELGQQTGRFQDTDSLESLADVVARYGGEEFVLLLPDMPLDEAQLITTRLQRALSGGLFMHEQKKVLVTFSAGITCYREGERLEDAQERPDQGLYEAKRTGKNRTCVG